MNENSEAKGREGEKGSDVDLSELRGIGANEPKVKGNNSGDSGDPELDALAELVPELKMRKRLSNDAGGHGPMSANQEEGIAGEGQAAVENVPEQQAPTPKAPGDSVPMKSRIDSTKVYDSESFSDSGAVDKKKETHSYDPDEYNAEDEASSSDDDGQDDDGHGSALGLDDLHFEDVDSDNALNSEGGPPLNDEGKAVMGELNLSSAQSLSTATQTHEVRMPMYLPTFKPATGCTNASDFIVRCFVARLRSGITVVKHGRSRWCKSRLRVLHIHPDGRSLSWKPAQGEPTSSKRPPKLDLSTCQEVRHAWSPDPQNPMYTGTSILRQKCEAANAHKSFALIFPKRTVDITAVTADQCKVLMEGFSALCFRLQVANLAGRGANKKGNMPEEEEVATTVSARSATLTNNSVQVSPPAKK